MKEAQSHLTTKALMGADLDPQQQQWQQSLLAELEEYFSGMPTTFTVPIDWSDYTEFRQ